MFKFLTRAWEGLLNRAIGTDVALPPVPAAESLPVAELVEDEPAVAAEEAVPEPTLRKDAAEAPAAGPPDLSAMVEQLIRPTDPQKYVRTVKNMVRGCRRGKSAVKNEPPGEGEGPFLASPHRPDWGIDIREAGGLTTLQRQKRVQEACDSQDRMGCIDKSKLPVVNLSQDVPATETLTVTMPPLAGDTMTQADLWAAAGFPKNGEPTSQQRVERVQQATAAAQAAGAFNPLDQALNKQGTTLRDLARCLPEVKCR